MKADEPKSANPAEKSNGLKSKRGNGTREVAMHDKQPGSNLSRRGDLAGHGTADAEIQTMVTEPHKQGALAIRREVAALHMVQAS